MRLRQRLLPATVTAIAAALVVSGCGSEAGHPTATAAARVAPGPQPSAPIAPGPGVYGTKRSPQAVADDQRGTSDPANPQPELQPLPVGAFRAPIRRYRAYSSRQAVRMAAATTALRDALRAGDRSAAQRAWARAYGDYLRIGAAYGALGALDQAIDGTPGGLAGGDRDRRFVGLHRLERGLWTGEPLARMRPLAARLQHDVSRLRRRVWTVEITPLIYATRAHEILEDVQRDTLSGRTLPWSGAGVLATDAGLSATREVIATLRPLLQGRGDALGAVDVRLAALGAALRDVALGHGHGGAAGDPRVGRWPALATLSRRDRERLDGRLGAALEALSAVPDTLATVRTPTIPPIPSR